MNQQMARKSLFVLIATLLVASLGASVAGATPANASNREGNYIGDGIYAASSNPTGMQLVQAMSMPGFYATVTSAEYEGHPAQKAIFTQTIQGFPLQGSSFTLLSSGVAADAPGSASYFASTGMGGVFKAKWGPYGLDAYDVATLSLTLQVPNDASILSFLYKYGTEESPTWLGTQYKDYFRIMADVPEMGCCPLIRLLPDGSFGVHIDNAAKYSNVPGGSSVNPLPPLPEPNDTVYNGVTELQTVEFDVSPYRGMEMTLIIEVADVSDPIYDTAIFLDGFDFVPGEVPNGPLGKGKTVYVTASNSLWAREEPGTGKEITDLTRLMQRGNRGIIVDGPVSSDGYTWWKVKYDVRDVTGWSAGEFLNLSPPNPEPSPPKPFDDWDFDKWAEEAVEWAEQSRQDGTIWKNEDGITLCMRFVASAFKLQEASAGYAGAIDGARKLYRFDQAPNGWENAPKGAVFFFDAVPANWGYGHVGIYVGGAEVLHVWTEGKVEKHKMGVSTYLTNLYIGWAYPPLSWAPSSPDLAEPKTLAVTIESPVSLTVHDAAGRVTGVVDGEIKAEIPGSSYDFDTETVTINPALEDYRIEIYGDEEGVYTLRTVWYYEGNMVCIDVKEVHINLGEVHQYDFAWQDIVEGKKGITIATGDKTINTSKPAAPGAPSPADGAADVATDTVLSWEAGDQVDTSKEMYYEIYLGTDPSTLKLEAVIGPFPATQSQITYQPKGNPGHLDYNTTYYWQIVVVDEFGIASPGPVWSFTTLTTIEAAIAVDPETLNLKARGQYVTAYIELPPGYDVSQIDVSSIRLNGTVPALGKPTEIGDYDNDGIPDLMVKFHRTMVQDVLTVGEEVEVTITGEVDGIIFEGSNIIRVITAAAAPGRAEWTRVTTPTTEGFVLAPDSVIVDYAVADDGKVAYAIVYSYDTSQFHLLKSTDYAATWEDSMDALEEEADGDINWLVAVATDAEDADFVTVALEMADLSVHVFISDDGGATFEDAGEVEDGGIYFSSGYHVSDLEVSPEVDGKRDIAIGGMDDSNDAALFRCTVTGDSAGDWEDATTYVGWDDDGTFTSMLVTDIIFSPSWDEDKTILVTTVTETGMDIYTVHVQSGSWGTSEGWNEYSTLAIEAVPILDDVDIPMWLSDLDAGLIAGMTLPEDYYSKNSNDRVLWVWVNYYDGDTGDPMCAIIRVDDDSADWVFDLGQVEYGEVWLTNISYKGTIDEGEAIAGVLGTGTYDPVYGSTDDLITECCYGVQVYRHDGIWNMDICCEPWHKACEPPTGAFAMAVSYVGEDKAYAVPLWGFFSPYDEDAWSVTFDDGDTWNQLSLIDTHIDYLSDVAVSPDCYRTMLISVNEESGCQCDSVWLHAEHLPEAEEYDGKWLRTWCGQLEGLDNDGYEHGILRLPPNETTGDTVYLADLGSNNVYQLYREIYDVDCWCSIASTELDYIVDLVAQDANTVLALDYYGDVAMFDDDEWQEAVDSEVDNGYTIAVWGGHVLVGGQNGDVSYSNDGGETFALLEEFPTIDGYVSVAFDTYFDTNNVIYAALANAGDDNGIYRWVIGESIEWEDLGAEDYAYTGLVLDIPSGGKPKTSADTGGVLYASYVSGDTTGVARCLTPAEEDVSHRVKWNYLTNGLTSELFKMTPRALKICGGLTTDPGSRLFAIDSSDYYDMESGMTGSVWSFED